MKARCIKRILFIGLFVSFPLLPQTAAQSLKVAWSKEFSKPVSWFARASPGIVIARVDKGLVALGETDGRQLWMLPKVEFGYVLMEGVGGSTDFDRGRNVLEVPAFGVLILNRVKLDGEANWRMVALNLATGKKLWDQEPVDDLMTVVPLYESGQIVVVSRRVQRRILTAEVVASTVSHVPFVMYPYRFEMQRMDLATGKVQWTAEYERTFTPGTGSVQAIGAHLLIYFGNRLMGCVSLEDGKFLWEDGSKHFGNASAVLPVETADGKLIYSSEYVRAIDAATQKEEWSIEQLGKVTGIFVHGGLAVALGEKNIAAAETATGKEIWRQKTHGHTANLLWEKTSDSITYTDSKGLHSVERSTGKALLEANLHVEALPIYIWLGGPAVVVTMSVAEVCAYSIKTGKKLFTMGKLTGFFRSDAVLDAWPLPERGEDVAGMSRPPETDQEWEGARKATLLTTEGFKKVEERFSLEGTELNAYETTVEGRLAKTWWIDPKRNEKVEISPSGSQTDVDRQAGIVIEMDGNAMRGAAIVEN